MAENSSNHLPLGWIKCKLLDCGHIVSGGTPSTKISEYWGEEIIWITPADLSGYESKLISKGQKSITRLGLLNSSAKLMPKGSILFSSRAPIGYAAIAQESFCTNQGFKSIVPNGLVFNEFLYYYLKASKNLAEKYSSGTTFKEISQKSFSQLPILVPPLSEQYRIVAKIEELFSEQDKGVEALKTAQQQLKIYREAVLKRAFEGKLTEEWRSHQKLPNSEELEEQIREREKQCEFKRIHVKNAMHLTKIEISELPNLPKGWLGVRLGDIIDEPRYGTSKKCYYEVKGKPVLRIPNIGNRSIDNRDMKYARFNEDEIATYKLSEGDILIIRSNGSIDLVGKCALISREDEKYLFAGYLIRLKPWHELIKSKYLLYLLSSVSLRNQIESKAKSTSGVNNINSNELKSLIIPICSTPEQTQVINEIVIRFSVADKLEEAIANSLKQAEALRQSILKKAFEGKLVPQNPNDEPAAELLDRIKAEQSARDSKIKNKKKISYGR